MDSLEFGELTPNIRMIIAAPELLAACENALEDGERYRLSEDVKRQLKRAICKAKGMTMTEYELKQRVKELQERLEMQEEGGE